MHAMLADRPQQRLDEPAMAAAADNQQLGSGGRSHQHLRSVPRHDLVADGHVPCGAADLTYSVGDDLPGEFLPVDVRYQNWIALRGGELPCDDRLHHRAR
jgi:hypothetical protein